MTNDFHWLPILSNTQLGSLRVVSRNGEPWFVLKDVCDILGLTNPSMVAERLDQEDIVKVDPKLDLGSRSNTPIMIVNEPGLYDVILRSDKPIARQFKHWITHEVLPMIRRHGRYELGWKKRREEIKRAIHEIKSRDAYRDCVLYNVSKVK